MPFEVRLKHLEDELLRVRNRVEDYPALRQQVIDMSREMEDIGEEMKSLRRALYTAAISIAGGAILFALTIFQVLGD